jgi:iron complex transport system substrate-binding protein
MRLLQRYLALLLSLLALVACAAPATQQAEQAPPFGAAGLPRFPLTLTGSDGRAITLTGPAQRIVSFSPAHTEILFAIGAGGRVVGVDDFADYPPQVKELPRVGYSTINVEKVVGLQPDFVFAATRQRRFVPELEQAGLTVLYREEPATVEGIFEHIRVLGQVTGNEAQAEELIAQMRRRIEAIQAKLAPVQQGPRVFYELTPELYTAGPKSFIGDVFRMLKAQNIAEGIDQPFPQLSQETLIARDPQVIVLADAATYGLGKESPDTVKARPGWSTISAVKEGRIIEIDSSLVSRPGPRIVDGLETLAKALYPERFP